MAVRRDAAALQRFVAWPPHLAVMRAYRGRGSLPSTTWHADGFDQHAVRTRARAELRTG